MPAGPKLEGMLGLRATLVFRLQIASNPFLAGRLRLTWFPESLNMNSLTFPTHASTTVSGACQLPGVELDLCESTSCVLRIPWVHSNSWISAGTVPVWGQPVNDTLGSLTIWSYLPLTVAAGTASPTYNVWFHLEDLEFVGASVSQTTGVVPQGVLSAEDAEAGGAKPLSSALASAGNTLRFISRGIPAISSYAGTASWALRTLSGYASAWGFSKPYVSTSVMRMVPTNYTFQGNSDGFDTSYNVGLLSDAHVTPSPLGGSDVDEMAFDFILGQYGLISNGVLSSSDVYNQVKYACTCSPNTMFYQSTYNLPVSYTPVANTTNVSLLTTPPFYLAQCFALWQGSFRFRIKIAKTKFHTGRLLLSFLPLIGQDPSNTTAGIFTVPLGGANTALDYPSIVWDLREGNVMEFDVPWISRYPYLPVSTSIGNFIMTVIEPLGGPTAVSSSVPFAVEVKCLPGFQFQVPGTPRLFMTPPLQSIFFAQGIFAEGIINDERHPKDAEHCIGEQVFSVKSLITRACPYTYLTSPGASTASVPPWMNYVPSVQSPSFGPPTTFYTPAILTWQNYFLGMYAYARGSTMVDVVTASASDDPIFVASQIGPALNTSGTGAPSTYTAASVIFESLSRALHFKIPYYNFTSRNLIRATTSIQFGLPITATSAWVAMRRADISQNAATAFVCTRAADDAQLGYFIGTPPLDLPISGSTPNALAVLYDNYLTSNTP
jgi:hypothetical protein